MPKSDARRYRRISLNLPAQISVNAVDDHSGQLLNISPGDLAVLSDAKVVAGDAVIVRVKGLEVIEGTVSRILPDGFAVSFLLSKNRRARLTEQLMLRANEQFNAGLGDRRESPRRRGAPQRTICRLADGTSLHATLLDESVDGAALEAPRRPAIGADIHIGRRRGVVIRHTPRGFVVVYNNHEAETARPVLRAV